MNGELLLLHSLHLKQELTHFKFWRLHLSDIGKELGSYQKISESSAHMEICDQKDLYNEGYTQT